MSKRFRLPTILLSGLVAIPLLLLVGCSESAFTASDDETTLAQENDGFRSPGNLSDEEASSPLADCAKPNSKKVLVCHVPPGNPIAQHTICISESGATHGHGLNLSDLYAVGGHGGDKLGACDDELPDSGTCAKDGC